MALVEFDPVAAAAKQESDRILADLDPSTPGAQILGLINKSMEAAKSGLLELPRIEDDEFISSERLKELADRANINNKVLLAECETLMATAQVIESFVTGVEKETLDACSKANEAVLVLLSYHSALANSGKSVVVLPEHMSGKFSVSGSRISSQIVSSADASLKAMTTETSGSLGNLFEISPGPQSYVALSNGEFTFIDRGENHQYQDNTTDGAEDTMLEAEGYIVTPRTSIAVVDREVMPQSVTKVNRVVKDSSGVSREIPFQWSTFDDSNGLSMDMVFESDNGSLNSVLIKVASRTDVNGSAIPLPSVERVDVSSDGNEWTRVECSYDAIVNSSGGQIRVLVNASTSRFVRIRLRQSVSYQTQAICAGHWMTETDGSKYWMSGSSEPAWTIGVKAKTDWFSPVILADVQGNYIERRIFAVDCRRYAIAVKEVTAEMNRYESKTVAESKSYSFGADVATVMIRAQEDRPEGTEIKYEISHDNGGSWVEIVPLERSGSGAEVVIFSTGGSVDPNIRSARYVNVQKLPRTINVRATLTATDTKTPSISRLSIEPTFR